jgi:hypothetical protein
VTPQSAFASRQTSKQMINAITDWRCEKEREMDQGPWAGNWKATCSREGRTAKESGN